MVLFLNQDMPVAKCFGQAMKSAMLQSTEPDIQEIGQRTMTECYYTQVLKEASEGNLVVAEARTSLEYYKRAYYTNR